MHLLTYPDKKKHAELTTHASFNATKNLYESDSNELKCQIKNSYLVIDAVLLCIISTRNVVEVLTEFCVGPVVDSMARTWTNVITAC